MSFSNDPDKKQLNSLTVVIRSSSERTADVCSSIIGEQVNKDAIFVIQERPFSAAVAKTFSIGLEQNRKWTLGVDADILLRSSALKLLIERAESLPDTFFMIQGRVLDKLFCFSRNGGPHLFRTSLLERALPLVPHRMDVVRPEAETVRKMIQLGYHYYKGSEVYGLHDYHQYRRDIFRKAMVYAKKFRYHRDFFFSEWTARSSYDDDYKVALVGLALGEVLEYSKIGNSDKIWDFFRHFIDLAGYSELAELDARSVMVDQEISAFRLSAMARAIERKDHMRIERSDKMETTSAKQLFGSLIRRTGKAMVRLGQKFE